MASSPKRPEKTSQEVSIERRQASLLDDEIAETEERLRLISRGKLGRESLLSGAPKTASAAASRGRSMMGATGAGGNGSRTVGGGTGGGSGGSGGRSSPGGTTPSAVARI
jgi:hypothetical protein